MMIDTMRSAFVCFFCSNATSIQTRSCQRSVGVFVESQILVQLSTYRYEYSYVSYMIEQRCLLHRKPVWVLQDYKQEKWAVVRVRMIKHVQTTNNTL